MSMPTNDEIEWKDCWKKPVKVQYKEITETIEIETREGKLYGYADKDVLLKGVKGEIYPCKIDIFNATYTTTEPLSEKQIRADTAKQIFSKLNGIRVSVSPVTIGLDLREYIELQKEYNIEA